MDSLWVSRPLKATLNILTKTVTNVLHFKAKLGFYSSCQTRENASYSKMQALTQACS